MSSQWFDPTLYSWIPGVVLGVFGGALGYTSPCVNDLWELRNPSRRHGAAEWVQLKPRGDAPTPRADHSAVWIPRAQRMLVLVGQPEALGLALGRVDGHRRHTRLAGLVAETAA